MKSNLFFGCVSADQVQLRNDRLQVQLIPCAGSSSHSGGGS